MQYIRKKTFYIDMNAALFQIKKTYESEFYIAATSHTQFYNWKCKACV